MLIIDAHLDLSWNALNWNRDLTLPIKDIRQSETGMNQTARGTNTVSLPSMREGNVAVCLATILARANPKGRSILDFRNQEIASAMAQGQLAYYRILETQKELVQLRDWAQLDDFVQSWPSDPRSTKPVGYILSMEGADPILDPKHLEFWWGEGLRTLGLAHYGVSAYAHGTASEGGLTQKGKELVRFMDELGMILDVTHLAEESFWGALKSFNGTVIASHNNCRRLVPGDRQFSDEQLRALIERDVVIGAAFDNWMLHPGWVAGQTPNSVVNLGHVIDHMDYICQLAGNSKNIGIGSDLDGGFGTEQSPHDLNTIADLQKIPELLRTRGYLETDIKAVMHGNWLRSFRKAWERDANK
jgi:membrane dipeptidase